MEISIFRSMIILVMKIFIDRLIRIMEPFDYGKLQGLKLMLNIR